MKSNPWQIHYENAVILFNLKNKKMKKLLIPLSFTAIAVVCSFLSIRTYQSYVLGDSNAFLSESEALASCEVTASATKGFITVASAYLECKGSNGTCQIPSNEFGLTASCSGSMTQYDLYVMGVKVN